MPFRLWTGEFVVLIGFLSPEFSGNTKFLGGTMSETILVNNGSALSAVVEIFDGGAVPLPFFP
jgi:hypothetical protein